MRRVGIGAIAIVVLGIVIAGCGGSSAPKETPAATPKASATPQSPADVAQQMAQGLQQLGKNQAPAVDFEKLVALVPQLNGWERSEPKGEQVTMGVSLSNAKAEYTKGDSTIRLEITDAAFNQLVLAPLSMMLMANYSERSSSGYKKYAAIGGNPGFESWENEPKDGEVTVVIAQRFVVNAKGSNVPNIDVVRSLVQAVDLTKLAALK